MKITKGDLNGLFIIEPTVFEDARGYFFESFNQQEFNTQTGLDITFVQDNESLSEKDVLRGLHFQAPPFAQGKLVRVIKGSVLDVAVDIRKNSPTYGQHQTIVLSEKNKRQFFVPAGFAHGFLTLEDNTLFSYKCTNYYNKQSEGGILWDDSTLNIQWGINQPKLSEKDCYLTNFNTFASPF
ncbi:MAG: dTDP-4-dehydrorhamnose 3,5-epimerase [Crocinitomicaceae bacterium]